MAKSLQEIKTPSRMRIELGPGGIIFFVVCGLMMTVAWYAQAPLLIWAFGLMVGSLFITLMLPGLMLKDITVKRVLPSHGVTGESLSLRYHIHNPKRILPAFGLLIGETWGRGRNGWLQTGPMVSSPPRLKGKPLGWIVHIGPGQRIQAEAPCWPIRRGYLELQAIHISTTFPFGILRWVREFQIPGRILIYPTLVRIDRKILFKLSDIDPFGNEHIDRGGGTEEFYGLREYRPGDSLKMIDWKRTARTGKLVTREMTQPSPPKLMVALDLTLAHVTPLPSKDGEPTLTAEQLDQRIEQAVSMTASIICDAYFHGYQIGLAIIGVPFTSFPVHHSLPHRTKILEALAQLDSTIVSRQPNMLPCRPNVIICLNTSTREKEQDPNQMVMDASQMQDYVMKPGEGEANANDSMLQGRHAPRSRRQQVRESQTWG